LTLRRTFEVLGGDSKFLSFSLSFAVFDIFAVGTHTVLQCLGVNLRVWRTTVMAFKASAS
jgi:hypothetical protein